MGVILTTYYKWDDPPSGGSLSGTTSPFDQILPGWSTNRKKGATKGYALLEDDVVDLFFEEKRFLVLDLGFSR